MFQHTTAFSPFTPCPYYCTLQGHCLACTGVYVTVLHLDLSVASQTGLASWWNAVYESRAAYIITHQGVIFPVGTGIARRKFLNITGNYDQKKRLTLPYSLLWINIYILFFLQKKDFDSCIHSFTEKWPWPLILYSRIVFCFVFVL